MNASVNRSIVTQPPAWFTTGCSTGFGLELAKQAIEHGYRTVMTARGPSRLEGHGATDNVLVLKLDVTRLPEPESVRLGLRAPRDGGRSPPPPAE